jgi:hypothetical protein
MSVSFYYDTMQGKQVMMPCYLCERQSDKYDALSDELRDKVYQAVIDVSIRNADSEENKHLLSLMGMDNCEVCSGKGYSFIEEMTDLNFSNSNAFAILSLMGYKDDKLHYHSVPVSEFKRRLIYATNVSHDKYVREDEIEYGKPREVEPGVVNMKPIRTMSFRLSSEDIIDKLKRLMDFAQEAEKNNANEIYWS